MNPSSFLAKILPLKKEEKEFFLALQIKSGQVKAAVWEKEEEKITLIALSDVSYSGDWEEVVRAADEAIVEASGGVPQEKIEKVILGLPQDWASDNKILTPHLTDLKKLCTQLSLKPLGFVVIPEAILNYLKQIEGVPPTALLIGLDGESLTLTLVKAGRIEGSRVVKNEEGVKLPEKVEEAVASFGAEVLPSRIILYDGKWELEELKDNLSSHHWSDKLPFLHLPKIEILEKNFDIRALALASGLKMGGVVAQEEITTEEPAQTEEDTEEPEEEVLESVPQKELLGFVKDRDILENEGEEEERVLEYPQETGEKKPLPSLPKTGFKPRLPSLSLPSLPSFDLPQFNFSFLGGAAKPLFFLALLLVFAAGGAFAAWWYLPKAEVKIWVEAKPMEKEAEITLAQSEGIPGEVAGVALEVEESASKIAAATGKKTVGDPAKGKIAIYNKTENEKKFPQGTVLLGGGLKFTLDEEVTVASTAAFSTSFSSVEGEVTAFEVGPEGNLGGGTNFSFKDFPTSSYFAKTEEGLSGGTSKEVPAVAKADRDKLLEELSAELTRKAKGDLQGKLKGEEKLVEETLTQAVEEKKFDKEVGEEASEVSLTLSVNFKALSYNEGEVRQRFLKILEEATPPGHSLVKEETKIEILGVNKKVKETTVKMVAKAKFLPKLNLEEIKTNIVGKKKSAAEEYLKNLGGVSQVEILIRFPLPLRLQTLPHLLQNITLEAIST